MTGATWTIFGAAPIGFFQNIGSIIPGAEVGTSVLQNATIETYSQGADTTLANSTNGPVQGCFSCHQSADFTTSHGFDESHDFWNIAPLPAFANGFPYMTLAPFPSNLAVNCPDPAHCFHLIPFQVSVHGFNNFAGNVGLSAEGLPPGVTAFFSRNQTAGTSMVTLAISPQTPPGVSTITIKGTSGNLEAFTTVFLTVNSTGNN